MVKISKGILIGMGAILPGVSGGMIAASLNVYSELIEALNNFTKTPIKAVIKIWQYLLGIFLGVLVGFLIIALVYSKIPIPTTFIFLGIILSTLPFYIKKVELKTLKFKHYLTAFITAIILIATLFLTQSNHNFETNYLIMIIVGIMLALSLIVPGLSGTMLLMALGFYKPLVNMFKTVLDLIVDININGVLGYIPYLLVLGVSGLLALILLAKLIDYLIKNYQRMFDVSILAIIITSPFTILYSLHLEDTTLFRSTKWYVYVISGILLVVSFCVFYYLNKKEAEKEQIEEVS